MTRISRTLQALFSQSYCRYTLLTFETLKSAFAIGGAIWLPIECAAFFFPQTAATLRSAWPTLLATGILLLAWSRRPVLSITARLPGRDVEIEIAVTDIFDIHAARVIGINTTFDTDINGGIISRDSLQGQFTIRFYDNVHHLDTELSQQLADTPREIAHSKIRGKNARHRIGTVVRLTPKNSTHYLVAIADMNDQCVAHSTFDNIKTCLAELWEFVSRSGVGGLEPIAIPLLGSGNTRLTETRAVIAREIIKSFIAASASRKFCEKLILVVSPHDYRTHGINLHELGEFLRYICKYTEFKTTGGVGQPVASTASANATPSKHRKSTQLAASPSAAEELLCAAASNDGRLLVIAHLGGEYVQAAGRKFPEDESHRGAAQYKAAIEELINQHLVQPVGHEGVVFELTHEGYSLAESRPKKLTHDN